MACNCIAIACKEMANRRHDLSAHSLIPQALHSFCSSSRMFQSFSWGKECLTDVSIGTGPDNSAFWLVVVFGGGLSLLQREVFLVRGEDCTGHASSSTWTQQVVFGNTYVYKHTYECNNSEGNRRPRIWRTLGGVYGRVWGGGKEGRNVVINWQSQK